jgi:FAD synthase
MKKIKGVVIHGNALGRTIGFPTANIAYSENDIEESVFHLNIVL